MDKIKVICRILSDESGSTSIEYGLIAGLIAIASAVAIGAVGSSVSHAFQNAADELSSATQ